MPSSKFLSTFGILTLLAMIVLICGSAAVFAVAVLLGGTVHMAVLILVLLLVAGLSGLIGAVIVEKT